MLGPFLDKTDGVTEETGLSPTVEVSKNGGAFGARNDATAIAHDSNGWYTVVLDATDTGTLGILTVKVDAAATHLPVWKEYSVVHANVYAEKYSTGNIAGTVATVTTNTDMRGTDSAALASVCTEARLAELGSSNLPTDIDAILADTGTDGVVIGSATQTTMAEVFWKLDMDTIEASAPDDSGCGMVLAGRHGTRTATTMQTHKTAGTNFGAEMTITQDATLKPVKTIA